MDGSIKEFKVGDRVCIIDAHRNKHYGRIRDFVPITKLYYVRSENTGGHWVSLDFISHSDFDERQPLELNPMDKLPPDKKWVFIVYKGYPAPIIGMPSMTGISAHWIPFERRSLPDIKEAIGWQHIPKYKIPA